MLSARCAASRSGSYLRDLTTCLSYCDHECYAGQRGITVAVSGSMPTSRLFFENDVLWDTAVKLALAIEDGAPLSEQSPCGTRQGNVDKPGAFSDRNRARARVQRNELILDCVSAYDRNRSNRVSPRVGMNARSAAANEGSPRYDAPRLERLSCVLYPASRSRRSAHSFQGR
jgi:hypothetical protein